MRFAGLAVITAFALALTACGGGSNPVAVAPAPQSPMARPDAGPLIYTANRDDYTGGILAFKAKASGNVAPVVSIAGPKTKLQNPTSLALDASGNIYTANDSGTKVYVFAASANGNVKPKKTIGGSKSHLGPTEGLFIDPSGNLWVTNFRGNAITEYAAGAHGNVKPIDTISGGHTQLNGPFGMAMDTTGRLFVANGYAPSILAFAAGASGNAAPVVSISGSNTELEDPFALAFDSNGRLLVADKDVGVLVFPSGANGNVSPTAIITGLSYTSGVVADVHDHIYAEDGGNNLINEYASNANGSAPPLRTIQGSNTTLNDPFYLVLH